MQATFFAIVFLFSVFTSCAASTRRANFYSITAEGHRSERYSRINQYDAYGQGQLGGLETVAAAYENAQHAAPPVIEIEVFNASLPNGVKLRDGLIEVEPNSNFEALGRFQVGYFYENLKHDGEKLTASGLPKESELEPDLRRLAAVLNATTLVVQTSHLQHSDARVMFFTGFALRKRSVKPYFGLGESSASSVDNGVVTTPRQYLKLLYSAVTGCPSTDAVADDIAAQLGYSPWQQHGTAVAIKILSNDKGFHAALVLGAQNKARTFPGATCQEAIDLLKQALLVEIARRTP